MVKNYFSRSFKLQVRPKFLKRTARSSRKALFLSVKRAEDCVSPVCVLFLRHGSLHTPAANPIFNETSAAQPLHPTLSIIELRAKVVTRTTRMAWQKPTPRRFEPYLSATCHRPSDVTRFTNIPMVIVHLTDWSGHLGQKLIRLGLQFRSIRLFSEMKKNSVAKQKVISNNVSLIFIEELQTFEFADTNLRCFRLFS